MMETRKSRGTKIGGIRNIAWHGIRKRLEGGSQTQVRGLKKGQKGGTCEIKSRSLTDHQEVGENKKTACLGGGKRKVQDRRRRGVNNSQERGCNMEISETGDLPICMLQDRRRESQIVGQKKHNTDRMKKTKTVGERGIVGIVENNQKEEERKRMNKQNLEPRLVNEGE